MSRAGIALVFSVTTLTAALPGQVREWRPGGTTLGLTASAPLVHDAARGRTLMLRSNEMWESDGTDWRLRLVNPPYGYRTPMLAYDTVREVVVLFGGDPGRTSTDTWEWDGAAWRRRTTLNAPTGRWLGGMTFDTRRGVTILYGGETPGGRMHDTWEYDGLDWTQRVTAHAPTANNRLGMTFDEARGVAVLFGGTDSAATTELDETWEYDGVDWVRRSPGTRPGARRNFPIAYDALRGRTIVASGYGPNVDPGLTWEWDGATWTSRRTDPAPGASFFAHMSFDRGLGRTVLVDGLFDARTMHWDGVTWRSAPRASPPVRDLNGLSYDPARDALVLFGGEIGTWLPPRADTWERRGGRWFEMSPATVPPARGRLALAFDPVHARTLMFGGNTGGALLDDTWHWDGSDWTALAPANRPPTRSAHAMTTDTHRNRIVLFGGDASSGGWLDDTWEWDGTTWHQRAPATVPPARAHHAMAYDPLRRRTVMFGGGDIFVVPTLGDQWQWDGSDWTRVTPTTLPPRRAGHGMTFDQDLGVVVMTAGYDTFAPAFPVGRNDNWEWDGTDWTQRMTAVMPLTRKHYRTTFDALLGRTVLFGGDALNDTWDYGPPSAFEIQWFGAACPGTRGALTLVPRGTPRVGNRFFAIRVSSAIPATVVALALAPRRAGLQLPGGCTVLVRDPELCLARATDLGAAEIPLALPSDPALHGAELFCQAVALDPQGPFAGVATFSAGLRIRLD